MGLKVKLADAAQLVGRHERIVRWHITTVRDLPAVLDGRGYRIDVDDLERIDGWRVDRSRLARLEERDARTIEGLAAQLATLRAEVASLRMQVQRLATSPASPVYGDSAIPKPSESHYSASGTDELDGANVPAGIPPGSVPLHRFAEMHGLAWPTVQQQQRVGVITTLDRQDPARRRPYFQHWVTPAHAAAIVALWRERGLLTRECPSCPH